MEQDKVRSPLDLPLQGCTRLNSPLLSIGNKCDVHSMLLFVRVLTFCVVELELVPHDLFTLCSKLDTSGF